MVAHSNPAWAPCGICTGDHGASNPGACPVKSCDRPRTGFGWALWACLGAAGARRGGDFCEIYDTTSCKAELEVDTPVSVSSLKENPKFSVL